MTNYYLNLYQRIIEELEKILYEEEGEEKILKVLELIARFDGEENIRLSSIRKQTIFKMKLKEDVNEEIKEYFYFAEFLNKIQEYCLNELLKDFKKKPIKKEDLLELGLEDFVAKNYLKKYLTK